MPRHAKPDNPPSCLVSRLHSSSSTRPLLAASSVFPMSRHEIFQARIPIEKRPPAWEENWNSPNRELRTRRKKATTTFRLSFLHQQQPTPASKIESWVKKCRLLYFKHRQTSVSPVDKGINNHQQIYCVSIRKWIHVVVVSSFDNFLLLLFFLLLPPPKRGGWAHN